MNIVSSALNWDFMNEPLYRWWIWLGALIAFLWSWNAVIGFMK